MPEQGVAYEFPPIPTRAGELRVHKYQVRYIDPVLGQQLHQIAAKETNSGLPLGGYLPYIMQHGVRVGKLNILPAAILSVQLLNPERL